MKQLISRILKNELIAPNFYRMRIESPYLAKNSKPGQFIEVRCSENIEPLLRRPLGVHRITENGIEMLYEVVGKGTRLLSRKAKGDTVDIIGPLGNGFGLPTIRYPLNIILIAGGVGVAPLLALAECLTSKKNIYVMIGARSKSHVLCESDFKKLGAKVSVSTEDGSKGKKGLVTDMLKNLLADNKSSSAAVYACGPAGMLKAVASIAKAAQISCQVSLEERMACGVGVCLGCPVKTKDEGYKMVCKDGPVFNAEEIVW
jgi:dihydroorotate dehydrogenase electron transfer subunit